jgi:four helix bundle protein
MMDHDRLDVYQAAREFSVFTRLLTSGGATLRSDLGDQLRRASASIALNVAEGAGEFSRKEKARFYRIARRSATECAAVLDLLVDWAILSDDDVRDGRELLQRIVAMLVRIARMLESQARPQVKPGRAHVGQR